LAGGEARLWWN